MILLKQNFVSKDDINLVLAGLGEFFRQMQANQKFTAGDLKDFMEPIFERAGYRAARRIDEQTNILIIHDSGVGDFVNKSAAIREIRRIYPTAHITLVVYPRALDLAEHCPYVDEIIPNGRECDWHSLLEIYRWNAGLAQRLLRRRIDIVYAFTQYPSTILLSYMSGARERVSYKFTPEDGGIECGPFYVFSPLLTIEVPHQLYGTHSVENSLALVDYTLHAPVVNREAEVWFTPLDLHGTEQLVIKDINEGRKIYALCMGGTAPRKQWPPQNYAKLAKKILGREPKIKFVILGGGPMDEQSVAVFKQTLGDKMFDKHVIDLTNKVNFRQSAAILSLCSLYIGNDTGTMHMAAAVKTPVLMLHYFAADLPHHDHTAPKTDYPYHVPSVTVQPKHALDQCRESKDHYGCIVVDRPHCIAQITVETAFDAYNQLKKRIAEGNIEPLFIN